MRKISIILYIILIFSSSSSYSIEKLSSTPTKKSLVIYTNKSFAKELSGDHYSIKSAFEAKCDCNLVFVPIESGGAILSRLMLEGKRGKADLALGIDMDLMGQAKKTGLFTNITTDMKNLSLPIKWESDHFLPFDYGYLAFVYNKKLLKSPPTSLEELINYDNKMKIIIQDPRGSTVGLGFLLWMKNIYGDQAPVKWKQLFKKIVTVTKSWGESYALFLKGEANMVLTYSSSPVYHMIAEKNFDYKAADFSEGHFLQIELAGKLKNSPNPELADMFLNFILSQEFQAIIPIINYMYPVIKLDNSHYLPTEYSELIKPKKILFLSPEEICKHKNEWVKEWLGSTLGK